MGRGQRAAPAALGGGRARARGALRGLSSAGSGWGLPGQAPHSPRGLRLVLSLLGLPGLSKAGGHSARATGSPCPHPARTASAAPSEALRSAPTPRGRFLKTVGSAAPAPTSLWTPAPSQKGLGHLHTHRSMFLGSSPRLGLAESQNPEGRGQL